MPRYGGVPATCASIHGASKAGTKTTAMTRSAQVRERMCSQPATTHARHQAPSQIGLTTATTTTHVSKWEVQP